MTYRVMTEEDVNALTELRLAEYNLKLLVERLFPNNSKNASIHTDANYHIEKLFANLSREVCR